MDENARGRLSFRIERECLSAATNLADYDRRISENITELKDPNLEDRIKKSNERIVNLKKIREKYRNSENSSCCQVDEKKCKPRESCNEQPRSAQKKKCDSVAPDTMRPKHKQRQKQKTVVPLEGQSQCGRRRKCDYVAPDTVPLKCNPENPPNVKAKCAQISKCASVVPFVELPKLGHENRGNSEAPVKERPQYKEKNKCTGIRGKPNYKREKKCPSIQPVSHRSSCSNEKKCKFCGTAI